MGLTSGTQIGPYEIAALLGAGGMGEVYRAVDTRLGRQVAIKLLIASGTDSDRLRRFEVETRTVSSLQHANILALYDVGTYQERPFLVSELLQGETLRELLNRSALDSTKAVDLAIQLCHGLAAAHDKGIVHRDIKPENLFITREGVLKILDFGIAKRTEHETSRAHEKPAVTVTEKTETGTVLGTAGYMSPEQVRGQMADRRSDLFSVGAVLYEMFTGQRAFQRDSTLETAYAIVKDEPKELPPNVPPALAQIVRRCLEKTPADRFQSARDLAAALEPSRFPTNRPGPAETEASSSAPDDALRRKGETGESGTAPAQVLSPVPRMRPEVSHAMPAHRAARMLTLVVVMAVAATGSWFGWRRFQQASPLPRIMMAVLPFEDFTGDSQKEYFADGLTEGMISQLGRLQPERLAVIARTSVNQYRHTKKSVNEIGRELGVQYVLESSVQRVDNRVRIDAQLIQTSDQTQVWSESYDREIKDVLVLQSDVAQAIATQVRIKLSPEQSAGLARTRSLNPDAYDAYLRGRFAGDKATAEGRLSSIAYFQQAIKIDPNYAAAYAGLAQSYARQQVNANMRPDEVGPKARAAALQALNLDERLPEAHGVLALILLTHDWDWAGAELHYRRAFELDPNNPRAAEYLTSIGRHADAIAEIKRNLELAPLAVITNWGLGAAYYRARRYDEAIAQLERTAELDARFWAIHLFLGLSYAAKGRYGDALDELKKTGDVTTECVGAAGYVQALAGNAAEAQKVLDRMVDLSQTTYVPAVFFARIYAGLGRRDETFAWLEKAYAERSFWLIFLRIEATWDSLRDDPRFADLVRRVGIPELSQH